MTTITHEKVESNDKKGIDYNAVIEQFGCQLITSDLLSKIKQLTGKDKLHPLLENNIFFAHRDLDILIDKCLREKQNNFYIYTGRGPSTPNLHIGHMIPFITAKYLQDLFGVPVIIQITDDEKYYHNAKIDINHNIFKDYAIENIKDIISCGFDMDKTFIFINSIPVVGMKDNLIKLHKRIKLNHIKNIFGFDDNDNMGRISFPVEQMTPAFASSFPTLLLKDDKLKLNTINGQLNYMLFYKHNDRNNDYTRTYDSQMTELQNMRCLIVAGIDQDPYFRTLRDIATKINEHKPIMIYSRFLGSLQGKDKKMSSSIDNSSIFLSDTPKQVTKKINSAFSGGQETLELHRQLGGNPDIDVAMQYIEFFSNDIATVIEIKDKFKKGELLSGELKKQCITLLNELLKTFNDTKQIIDIEMIHAFMSIKPLII